MCGHNARTCRPRHHDGVAAPGMRGGGAGEGGCEMYFLCVGAGLFKHYLNGGCVPGESGAEVGHRDTD